MSKPDPKPQTGGRFIIRDGKLEEQQPATISHPKGDRPRSAKARKKPVASAAKTSKKED